jgi:hypothetical protein
MEQQDNAKGSLDGGGGGGGAGGAGGGGAGEVVTPAAVRDGIAFLRRRLCGTPPGAANLHCSSPLLPEQDRNFRHLQQLMAESVEHGYNNSVLLLGPPGCGKSMILEQVLAHLELQFKDRVSPVRSDIDSKSEEKVLCTCCLSTGNKRRPQQFHALP